MRCAPRSPIPWLSRAGDPAPRGLRWRAPTGGCRPRRSTPSWGLARMMVAQPTLMARPALAGKGGSPRRAARPEPAAPVGANVGGGAGANRATRVAPTVRRTPGAPPERTRAARRSDEHGRRRGSEHGRDGGQTNTGGAGGVNVGGKGGTGASTRRHEQRRRRRHEQWRRRRHEQRRRRRHERRRRRRSGPPAPLRLLSLRPDGRADDRGRLRQRSQRNAGGHGHVPGRRHRQRAQPARRQRRLRRAAERAPPDGDERDDRPVGQRPRRPDPGSASSISAAARTSTCS